MKLDTSTVIYIYIFFVKSEFKNRFYWIKYYSQFNTISLFPFVLSGHQGSSSAPGGNNFFEEPISQPIMNRPNFVIKPIPTLRPQAPPVRIDTCIVGDETTCEMDKHEVCLTYLGVSTCDCKPGYGRKDYRKACRSEFSFLFYSHQYF